MKSFSKDICNLKIRSNMSKSDGFIFIGLSDVAAVNLYMFCAFMEYWIGINWIKLVLSACRGVAMFWEKPSSLSSWRSHMISEQVEAMEQY